MNPGLKSFCHPSSCCCNHLVFDPFLSILLTAAQIMGATKDTQETVYSSPKHKWILYDSQFVTFCGIPRPSFSAAGKGAW